MTDYEKYQEYIKKITDTFVGSLTYNSAQSIEEQNTPNYKRVGSDIIFDENSLDRCPHEMDGVIKTPKDVVEAWRKIQNEKAIKWLNKNVITFEEWKIRNNKVVV
jgi:hypothetical protein